MSAPLIRRCAILALVAILAIGNSAGMQVVAWMSMIVDRVQTESIGEAIASTLQGVRPCALCKIAKVLAAHEAMAWTHQSPGKAPQQQHLSPHRSQQVKVQAALDHLPANQPRKDPQAPKKHTQP